MVRIKHRYLLINILYPLKSAFKTKTGSIPDIIQFHAPTPETITPPVLLRLIREGVTELFGDYGLGVISGSLKVMYFSTATSTAIIRVSRDHYRLVWAALCFVTALPKPDDGVACVFRVVRVSGTVRKAEEEAIRRARDDLIKAKISGLADCGDFLAGVLRGDGGGGGVGKGRIGVDVDDGDGDGDSSEDGDGAH